MSKLFNIMGPQPALPGGERKRGEHQALRSRLLNGTWQDDLEKALAKHISPERRSAWGIAEMSRNTFRSASVQIGGALYQSMPQVRTSRGAAKVADIVKDSGYWQLMQRVSVDLVGQREALIRVDYSERGGLLHRPVPVESCIVRSLPEAPDVPVAIEELQVRDDPETGKPAWCWEILDVTDLSNPVHMIVNSDRSKDWTSALLPVGGSGGDYLYRDAQNDGMPYLPVAMYHAERTGRLWDPYHGLEAVLGTLTIGVLLTFWVHGVKDGSFATVLLAGGRVVGTKITSAGGEVTEVISAEPGSIIPVQPLQDFEGQISVVQLVPGMDPEKLMSAIGMFEGGLAEFAGVSPGDLLRTSADPRSGVSLAISREGLRSAQARFEPQLRRGDAEVLSLSAKILNTATGSNYPSKPSDFTLSYPALPLSSAEIKALREDIIEKINTGLMSRVDGYIKLHPGLTRAQAVEELRRIENENRDLNAALSLPTDAKDGSQRAAEISAQFKAGEISESAARALLTDILHLPQSTVDALLS